MTTTKKPKKPKSKPIKEKELKKGGGIKEREIVGGRNNFVYIKELEALSHLAVNVRKLAKFKHETSPRRQQELLKVYGRLIDRLTSECETFLDQTTKEIVEEIKPS